MLFLIYSLQIYSRRENNTGRNVTTDYMMTPHKGQKALHPLLVGMCVGTFPPMAGNQQAAGPGHEEVKCQEQNVNSCWQAMQKTCSLRLREPWYFTKSNEHVSQHCRATIGLFKEEAQKAGRCYVTCRRDCFSCSSAGKALLWLWLLSSFHSLAPPVSHHRVPQWDTMTMRQEDTQWFTLDRHYKTAALSPTRSAVGPRSCALSVPIHQAPQNIMWPTAWAMISSRTAPGLKPPSSRLHYKLKK